MSTHTAEPESVEPDEPTSGASEPEEEVRDPSRVLVDNRRQGRELAALRGDLKAAQARIAELEGVEPDLDALDTAIQSATFDAQREAVAARVEAAAVRGGWAEPSDATLFVDVDALIGASREEIRAAVEEVVADRPHLLAKRARTPSFEQGPRGAIGPSPRTTNDYLLDAIGIAPPNGRR